MQAGGKAQWIIDRARHIGFDLCGVAPAADWEELGRLPEWLAKGYAGEMRYLHDPRRLSPAAVVEGARSVIAAALNYNTPLPYSTELLAAGDDSAPRGWISRYAWGADYHKVVGEKLDALISAMRTEFREPFQARSYVDTGPVDERVAAKYAALGWLGKNTCLINEKLGSWLFLGVILTDLDLQPSLAPEEPPLPDLCGNCRLCIDACPTGALTEPYVMDARLCISYLTIELRGAIPEELRPPLGRMVFGCDICQDVCPWNRKAPATELAAFLPVEQEKRNSKIETRNSEAIENTRQLRDGNRSDLPGSSCRGPGSPSVSRFSNDEFPLFAPSLESLAALTEAEFREIFRGSAVKRAKWQGLVRNACVALGNSGLTPKSPAYSRVAALLEKLARSDDSVIAEHARWALTRLGRA